MTDVIVAGLRRWVWLCLGLLWVAQLGCAVSPKKDDYRDVPPATWTLEKFIGSGYLEKQGGRLTGPMSIDSDGRVLIGTGDNLFDVGSRRLLLNTPHPELEEFTFTSKGGVLTVCHGKLGFLNSGQVTEKVNLPGKKMRLAQGADGRVYVYGGTGPSAKSIYLLAKGGRYSKLLDATEPVTALNAAAGKVFFAAGNVLYVVGGEVKPILALPGGQSISSIAVDQGDGTIYLTKEGNLYAVQPTSEGTGLRLLLVGKSVGDEVHVYNGHLYVLNREKGSILRANPRGK